MDSTPSDSSGSSALLPREQTFPHQGVTAVSLDSQDPDDITIATCLHLEHSWSAVSFVTIVNPTVALQQKLAKSLAVNTSVRAVAFVGLYQSPDGGDLSLEKCSYRTKAALALLESKKSHLSTVDLTMENIGSHSPELWFATLLRLPNVNQLDLDCCSLGKCLHLLAAAILEHKRAPSELYLRGNEITDPDCITLLDSLIKTKQEQKILLLANNLTGGVIPKLAEYLKANLALLHLGLDANKLTDSAIDPLIAAIGKHPALHTLDITENDLSQPVEKKLAIFFRKHPTLRKIIVNGKSVSDAMASSGGLIPPPLATASVVLFKEGTGAEERAFVGSTDDEAEDNPLADMLRRARAVTAEAAVLQEVNSPAAQGPGRKKGEMAEKGFARYHSSGYLGAQISFPTRLEDAFQIVQEENPPVTEPAPIPASAASPLIRGGSTPIPFRHVTPASFSNWRSPKQDFSRLGRGTFGEVFSAKLIGREEPVAVKISSDTSPEGLEAMKKELGKLLMLRNSRLLIPIAYFTDETTGQFGFVTELCANGSLKDFLYPKGPGTNEVGNRAKRLDIDLIKRIARCIASGLATIHQEGLVHNDIKPANILLTKKHKAQIADFGLAREIHDGSSSWTRSGTLSYAAPEKVFHVKGSNDCDNTVDIYATGLVLYELFMGQPFTPEQRLNLAAQVRDGLATLSFTITADWQTQVPPKMQTLLLECTHRDRKVRPSAEKLKATLKQKEVWEYPKSTPK